MHNTRLTLPKLMIFDMDGLIFDTERMFMDTRAVIMKEYGYVSRREDYIRTIGTAGETLNQILLDIYGPDYPADMISQKTRETMNRQMDTHGPDVKQGIPNLLQWLQQTGIPCCVASSSHRENVQKYLQLSGLEPYFSYLVCGDEIAHSKPAPDIFLKACQISDIEPADAMVLEDSENGIRAAHNAGIPVVCIPDLKYPEPEIAALAAAIVHQADDVISLFHQIREVP